MGGILYENPEIYPKDLINSMIKNVYSTIQRILINIHYIGKNSIIKYPYKIWGKAAISIGSDTFIAENSFLCAVTHFHEQKFLPKIVIGNNVCIGSNFFLACVDEVIIEDNVLMSDRVFISDHMHGYENVRLPIIDQALKSKGKVRIKEGSFIGINAVIMPGVTIGKNSIVGASAVVTKSVPDYAVVAGNPAKVIKLFNDTSKKWESK